MLNSVTKIKKHVLLQPKQKLIKKQKQNNKEKTKTR